MSQDSSKNQSKRKQLNIVYFIDSARTRSASLSVKSVYLIASFLILMLLWSLGSIYLLIHLGKSSTLTERELQSTRRLLFEYQVQYDRIFEESYPQNESITQKFKDRLGDNPTLSDSFFQKNTENEKFDMPKGLLEMIQNQDDQFEVDTSKDSARKSSTSKEIADNNLKKSDTPSIIPPKQSPYLDEILIQNQVLVKQGQLMSLSLDMFNQDQEHKKEGYLWIVAEFSEQDGRKVILTSPPAIQVASHDQKPKNPEKGSTFAIKRFKRKTFQFREPQDFHGKLVKLTLGITDKTGSQLKIVPLTLNVQNSSGSSLAL